MTGLSRRAVPRRGRLPRPFAGGVVVQDAHSPTVSADGTRPAYLTTDPATVANTLWVSQADGANPQPLMGAPEFRAELGEMGVDPEQVKVAQEYQILYSVELDEAGTLQREPARLPAQYPVL